MKKKHVLGKVNKADPRHLRIDCSCGYVVSAPVEDENWVINRAAEHLDKVSNAVTPAPTY